MRFYLGVKKVDIKVRQTHFCSSPKLMKAFWFVSFLHDRHCSVDDLFRGAGAIKILS